MKIHYQKYRIYTKQETSWLYNITSESVSKPYNRIGSTSPVPTLNKPKNVPLSFNNKDKYLILVKQEEIMNILRNNYKEKIALLEQECNKKMMKIEEKNK